MLKSILDTSQRYPRLVVFAVVVLMMFGAASMTGRTVDLVPEFSPTLVEIQTEAAGLPAGEVEALITVPLEEFLAGLPWLQAKRSSSINGLSSIVLEFQPGTNLFRARQMVQERLINVAALPNVSKPPAMMQPVSSINRVLNIGFRSDTVSLIDMSVLARWKIKPRLMGVKGVANVVIWGERNRQLQVQVDPAKLQASGATLLDVIKATGDGLWVSPLTFLNASTPGSGGFIDTPSQRLNIRHVLPISSETDLAKIVFRNRNGKTLHLGDVATVVEGHPPMIGDAVIKDGPGLMMVIEKFPWANTLEVARGIEEVLELLKPGLAGIDIDSTIFRPASFIESAQANLTKALLFGSFLMALALIIFIFDWRVLLISIVAIPVSIVATLVLLQLYNPAMNILVFAGLAAAIPVIVCNAVFDVEHIRTRLRERRLAGDQHPTAAIWLTAVIEMRVTLAFPIAIIIASAIPVFLLDGLLGQFFQPLGMVYLIAVLCSTAVALSLTPALCAILLPHSYHGSRSPLIEGLRVRYEALLKRITRAPGTVLLIAAIVAAPGFLALPMLEQHLLPVFVERDFLMRWQEETGRPLPEMTRLVSEASRKIRATPGVRNAAANIGRAVGSDRLVDVNTAEVWVSLDSDAHYERTTEAIKVAIANYPGLTPNALSFTNQRMAEQLTGENGVITVRVYGPDFDVLRAKAKEISEALLDVPGLKGSDIEAQVHAPHIEIEVNLDAAEPFGLKPGDIRRSASTLLGGIEVGSLFEGQKVFDVVVWGVPDARMSLGSIKDLLIDSPSGEHVRLGDVADVRMSALPSVINHDAASRRIDISATFSGRKPGTAIADIKSRIETIEFPREYHSEVLNNNTGNDGFDAAFVLPTLTVATAIFFLLHAVFGSWRMATMVFLSLPLAMLGGVISIALSNGVFSLGSFAGFLAIIALASPGAMVLFDQFQKARWVSGRELELEPEPEPELFHRAAGQQFILIIAAATSVGLAFLPVLIMGERPGLEILHPMAVVIIGGLITTILVLLFLLPTLYLRFAAHMPHADVLPVAQRAGGMRAESGTIRHTIGIAAVAITMAFPLWAPEAMAASLGEPPAVVEPIEGSEVKRLTLTEGAISRLGIETTAVREIGVTLTKTVGGEVVALPATIGVTMAAESGATVMANKIWIRCSIGAVRHPDVFKPVQIRSLTKQEGAGSLTAVPVMNGSSKNDESELYYELAAMKHGLTLGQRILCEVTLAGTSEPRKVIPYSALIYDEHGGEWAYVKIEPRVFVRHSIRVELIKGDVAILAEGPPAGWAVVSVGNAELYGTEFEVGH